VITLTVQSYNGAPLAQPLAADFDELGGSIGRADNNQLVLPDPERAISRQHASIAFRNGSYALIDRGSNPVLVNGVAVGNGREVPLRLGDEVRIGGYAMTVGEPTRDPFTSLGLGVTGMGAAGLTGFGGGAGGGFGGDGLGASRASAAAPGWPAAAAPAPAPASGGFGAPSAAGGIPDDWDPFAPDAAPSADLSRDLGRPMAGGAAAGGGFGAGSAGGFGGSGGAAGIGGDFADLGTRQESSLDDLFGLGPAGADPFGDLDRNLGIGAAPNTAGAADPLAALSGASQQTAAAAADHGSFLNEAFRPPQAVGARPAADPAGMSAAPLAAMSSAPTMAPPTANRAGPPFEPIAPTQHPAPVDAVLSWSDEADGDARTIIRPGARAGGAPGGSASAPPAPVPAQASAAVASGLPAQAFAPVATPAISDDLFAGLAPLGADPLFGFGAAAQAMPQAVPAEIPPAISAPIPAPIPAAPSPAIAAPALAAATFAAPAAPAFASAPASATPADAPELLAALRAGLGLADFPAALTPELMHLLGSIVREATSGTLDLLAARAVLKREFRAEVTMIVARENNPLKFSPSADVALGHLLRPPARGFMPAPQAMRDAQDDLRAHQFGVVAGMRAALEGVLARFDPATLEGRLVQKSMLSALLPGARKAQLWELFQQLYAQLSTEAAEDFHVLFGRAFLEAYEAHADQLHDAHRKDAP